MRIIDGIPVWGDPIDNGALTQIKTCSKEASYSALMGDHHKGYSVPIGGVVAYENKISPAGIGFDISCGNAAVKLNLGASDIRHDMPRIMDDIWSTLSFGIGQKNSIRVDHELFDDPAWKIKAASPLKEMARNQLGTIGSGNHFVDIFEDESGVVWAGVHFGSRGLGYKLAAYFLKAGGATDGIDVEPLILDVDSGLGSDYIQCMQLAMRYAYAGREWVCSEISKILGALILETVHNHHNAAWKEQHFGRDLWVVRKGATPAFPGQKGFVGGSMGDISVILEGVDSEESRTALFSTVHGAGRVMSRTEARGKIKKRNIWGCGNYRSCDGEAPYQTLKEGTPHPRCPKCGAKMHKRTKEEQVKEGRISKSMMMDWIQDMGVELRGAGTDEAPQAYKRLPEVLEHHKNTIKILHTLKPLGVAMAGENEHDPFKD